MLPSYGTTARAREARLKTNPVLTDLRLHVIDEESFNKVKDALKAMEDPETEALIEFLRPGELPRFKKLARQRLKRFDDGRA